MSNPDTVAAFELQKRHRCIGAAMINSAAMALCIIADGTKLQLDGSIPANSLSLEERYRISRVREDILRVALNLNKLAGEIIRPGIPSIDAMPAEGQKLRLVGGDEQDPRPRFDGNTHGGGAA